MAEQDELLVRAPWDNEELMQRANQHHDTDESQESHEDACSLLVVDHEATDPEEQDHGSNHQGHDQVPIAVGPGLECCFCCCEVGGELLVHRKVSLSVELLAQRGHFTFIKPSCQHISHSLSVDRKGGF